MLLGSAKISTIDSFYLDIVRANSESIGFSSSFRMADDTELLTLRKEIMNETIDKMYDAYPAFINIADLFSNIRSEISLTEELLELFERVEVSPIRAGLTNDELTITKAGWYPSDDGERYEATADAGIVFENGHAYVFVVMTDIADDLALLSELIPGIWSATSVLN
jgi:hypothetical protein